MKILILTDKSERHFYFCNEIIKNCDQVVGVFTGGKSTHKSRINKIKEVYKKKEVLRIIKNLLLNTLFRYWLKKLNNEKVKFEEKYFKNQKDFFFRHYKHLHSGQVLSKYISINNPFYVSKIKELSPDVIVVMGTCLIGKPIIDSSKYTLNLHTGLSPYFRGGNTNLWPFILGNIDYCGVTIHKLSSGIDSGDIIFSKRIKPSLEDCFSSINCNSIIAGTNLMVKALKQLENNKISSIPQWTKGKLFLNKDFNGYIAYNYFKNRQRILNKYIKNQPRLSDKPKEIS